jgi:hypothetical protein
MQGAVPQTSKRGYLKALTEVWTGSQQKKLVDVGLSDLWIRNVSK